MTYKKIAAQLIALKRADLALRTRILKREKAAGAYDKEMQQLHNENAVHLGHIIGKIGYPTVDKVGKEASEAAWMVIQHAIGQPDFMRRCRQLLEEAVKAEEADRMHLAYLTDRIAVLEGKPQLYGTQFDWDAGGRLSPNPYDDLEKVNERRKAIGLNTLEEQTVRIRQRAASEQQSPPADYRQRQSEYDAWRKKAGWI